jgi:hypothetical protein
VILTFHRGHHETSNSLLSAVCCSAYPPVPWKLVPLRSMTGSLGAIIYGIIRGMIAFERLHYDLKG